MIPSGYVKGHIKVVLFHSYVELPEGNREPKKNIQNKQSENQTPQHQVIVLLGCADVKTGRKVIPHTSIPHTSNSPSSEFPMVP